MSSAGVVTPGLLFSQTIQEEPPPLPGELVEEFVIAGHVDLGKTKAMLARARVIGRGRGLEGWRL